MEGMIVGDVDKSMLIVASDLTEVMMVLGRQYLQYNMLLYKYVWSSSDSPARLEKDAAQFDVKMLMMVLSVQLQCMYVKSGSNGTVC